MRVLIMGNNDQSGGGLSVHYITLARYLVQSNFELACININDSNNKIFNNNEIPELNIPFRPVTLINKLKKYLQLRKAVSLAKKFNPHIFIATALGNGYVMVASHLPSSVFKVYEEVQTDVRVIPLRLKMIKNFNAVGSQTEEIARQFKQKMPVKIPVKILPCFSKDFSTDICYPIPSAEKGIRLAFFGRLAANKGVKEFIQATHSIFKNNFNLTLDIFGKGPELASIQDEINTHHFQNQIQLKGFYTDEEFPELISSYHGIIIPSIDSEGLPLILIEAMRFGRPVLGTTIGAMSEVGKINSKGMIITQPNKDGFFKSLNLFLTSIKSHAYSEKIIHNVYEQYYSNNAFLEVWKTMLNNPKLYFSKTQLANA